jgi:hypothetical protein
MIKKVLLVGEGLAAVEVAGEDALGIGKPLDAGVEAAAEAAGEGRLLVALVAEVVLAGVAHHPDVDRVRADRTDLCLPLQALRVQLRGGDLTRTVALSPKTSSSSYGGSRGYLLSSILL